MAKKASPKSYARIELFRGVDEKWRWRMVCVQNGEILAVSEAYSKKDKCLRTATRVSEGKLRNTEVVPGKGKKAHWNLLARNRTILCTSEMYSSIEAATETAEAVKNAGVMPLTEVDPHA